MSDSMTAPAISVILPVYNGVKWVADAVTSVLEQDFGDWELIIIDDGSSDGTAKVLSGFDDPRIKVLSQENRGVSDARNRGLEAASGSFVTFLDADDLLTRSSFSSRVAAFQVDPSVDVVDGFIEIIDVGGEVNQVRAPGSPGELLPRLLRLDSAVFFNVSYMIRRASMGDVRFVPGLTHGEDLVFLLDVAKERRGGRYRATSDVIYRYRRHGASAMRNLAGLESGYLFLISHVQRSQLGTEPDRAYLRRRVARILALSWLRAMKPRRAVTVLVKLLAPALAKLSRARTRP